MLICPKRKLIVKYKGDISITILSNLFSELLMNGMMSKYNNIYKKCLK